MGLRHPGTRIRDFLARHSALYRRCLPVDRHYVRGCGLAGFAALGYAMTAFGFSTVVFIIAFFPGPRFELSLNQSLTRNSESLPGDRSLRSSAAPAGRDTGFRHGSVHGGVKMHRSRRAPAGAPGCPNSPRYAGPCPGRHCAVCVRAWSGPEPRSLPPAMRNGKMCLLCLFYFLYLR